MGLRLLWEMELVRLHQLGMASKGRTVRRLRKEAPEEQGLCGTSLCVVVGGWPDIRSRRPTGKWIRKA